MLKGIAVVGIVALALVFFFMALEFEGKQLPKAEMREKLESIQKNVGELKEQVEKHKEWSVEDEKEVQTRLDNIRLQTETMRLRLK